MFGEKAIRGVLSINVSCATSVKTSLVVHVRRITHFNFRYTDTESLHARKGGEKPEWAAKVSERLPIGRLERRRRRARASKRRSLFSLSVHIELSALLSGVCEYVERRRKKERRELMRATSPLPHKRGSRSEGREGGGPPLGPPVSLRKGLHRATGTSYFKGRLEKLAIPYLLPW